MNIGLSADEAVKALKDWISEDMKAQTSRYFELGKFLFSVSAGSMVFFVTALRAVGLHDCSLFFLAWSLVFLLAATLISIKFVWPRSSVIGSKLDIRSEYNKSMKSNQRFLVFWLFCQILGLGLGFLAIIEIAKSCDLAAPSPSY